MKSHRRQESENATNWYIYIYYHADMFIGEGNGNPLHILAWEIPCREKPGGLQSIGSQRVGHDLETKQQ